MQAQQQGQEPPPQPEPPTAEFMKTTKRGEEYDPAKFGLSDDARFDIIVDETPSSPNQKEATWAAIQPFMAMMPPNAIPIALRFSPLPESAAKELGDAITSAAEGPEQPEIPPEMQQMIEQGQARIAELEAENADLLGKREIEQAKVTIDQQDSETKRIKAMAAVHQPNEVDELRAHIAELARSQSAIIDALGGFSG